MQSTIIIIIIIRNVVCPCQIPIITLNLRVMRSTPPRVFLTLASTLILSAAVIYLI
jgi:hypothetical protein